MIKLNSEKHNMSLKILDDQSIALELYLYILKKIFMCNTADATKLAYDIKSKGVCHLQDAEFQVLMEHISECSDFLEEFGLSFNYQLSPVK